MENSELRNQGGVIFPPPEDVPSSVENAKKPYGPPRVDFRFLTQTEKAIFHDPFGKFGDSAVNLWGRQVVDRLTGQGQREALSVLRTAKNGRGSAVRDGGALDAHVSMDAVNRLINYIEYRVMLEVL